MTFLSHVTTYRNEYIASVAASLSTFMVVVTSAWSSPAFPKLFADDSPIPISADDSSWLVAITAIGGMFGPFITWACADRIGRKLTLLGCFVPVTIGWIIVGVGDSLWSLYISRVLFGLSYGTSYSVSPVYLGEIASPAIRGSAGTLMTVLSKIAFLLVFCVGPYVEYRTLAWICLGSPVLFAICFIWMPESPYYLLQKNKEEAAIRSLTWLRQTPAVAEEVRTMKLSLEESNLHRGSWKELFTRRYQYNLRIVLVLVFTMQFTGFLAVTSYAQTIFEKISTDLSPEEMSIVLGAVQLVAVIFPAVLVDRLGRRPLLLLSTVGATLGLLICSAYFAFATAYDIEHLGWIAFVSFLIFIVFYGMGLASVSFAVLSEIFPINIRAFANAFFTTATAISVLGVVKMFQGTMDNVGSYLPFGILGIGGIVGSILIYLYIPETKGKSLDEVQRIVASGRVKQK